MNFTFSHIDENFPPKCQRSRRLEKKLHVGKFAKTQFAFNLSIPLYEFSTEIQNKLVDIMCEHDTGCFVSSTNTKTHFSIISGPELTTDDVEKAIEVYIITLVSKLAEVSEEFKNIGNVNVSYGDAYYGDWDYI